MDGTKKPIKIFPSAQKSFRLFKLVSKDNGYLNENMRLTMYSGVAFLPLVTTREALADIVKKLFGTRGYSRYLQRYLFTKKFMYQPSLVSGKKYIVNNTVSSIITDIMQNLPKLRTRPGHRYLDKRNVILDFTDHFQVMLPKDRNLLSKPFILTYSENIYPELITRFGIDFTDESVFKYTRKYSSTSMKPVLSLEHEVLLVPIEINIVDNAVIQYLMLTRKVLRAFKVHPDTMRVLSLIRFVYKCYARDTSEGKNPSMDYFIKMVNEKNVKFIFYNSKYAFTVDFDDLRERRISSKTFYTMFKAKLIMLVSNNMGVQSDESIDDVIKEEDAENKEDIKEITVDLDKSFNKNAIKETDNAAKKKITTATDEPVHGVQTINDVKLTNIIKRANTKLQFDRKNYELDIKKKTDKVLSLIHQMKSVDIDFKFNPSNAVKYDPPLNYEQIVKKLGKKKADELRKDPVHRFRMDTGIELIHEEPFKDEQLRIWENWQLMTAEMKQISNNMSNTLFGISNEEHHKRIMATKWSEGVGRVSSTIELRNNLKQNVIDRKEMLSSVVKVNKKQPDDDIIQDEDEIDAERREEEEEDTLDDVPEDVKKEFNGDDSYEFSDNIRIENDEPLTEEDRIRILRSIENTQRPKKSPKQLRRIALVKEKYKSIKTNDDRTIEEILEDVDSKQIEFTKQEIKTVLDKAVTSSSLIDFEKSYIKKTMRQDILSVVKSFSNNDKSLPLYITKLEETDSSDRFNTKHTFKFTLEDENQKRHTIKVDIPIPNKDGILYIAGNKKVLKKQITPLPIIKIGPDRLAITSNSNKVIIYRQGTVLNRRIVAIKKIIEALNNDATDNFSLKYGDSSRSNKDYTTTLEYDELARHYYAVTVGPKGNRTSFIFNQKDLREEITKKKFNYKFSVDKLPIGIDYGKGIVIDFSLKNTTSSVGELILNVFRDKAPIKDIEKIITSTKATRRIYSRIKILNSDPPLIVFLGSLFGLRNVIDVNGKNYIFSTKPDRGTDKLSIRFKDGYLYYPEYPLENSLLLNGLTMVNTEEYNFDDFETPLPYIDFLVTTYKRSNHLKGYTGFKEVFLDNITLSILKDLDLPTNFLELFLYANEMLIDNSYAHATRVESYRIRGYELISTALYLQLADEYQILKQKGFPANSSLSVPQNCVIKALVESQILENYDTINPINEIKSKSACTFKGNKLMGSQSKHGFTLERRAFGEDAIGVFSISNVENHMVGVTKELTLNPTFLSTRGYIKTTENKGEIKKMSAAQVLSADELISPGVARHDSPNRVGFSAGQWKHTLGVEHNCPPMVSNGYDKVVAYQIGDTFVRRAQKNGRVVDIDEKTKSIMIEYDDDTKEVFKYGKEFVRNSSFFLENNLEINCKVGKKIKANDVLAYSKEFFVKQGNDLIFTQGVMAKVALLDDYFTNDDSSLVSNEFAELMANNITQRKQISLLDSVNILNILKEGDYVEYGDPLITFEDASSGADDESQINEVLNMMGDADQAAIDALLYHSPKANATGTITKIDIYWTGELDTMSESCQKIIKAYIRRKKEIIDYEEKYTKEKSFRGYEYKKSVPVFKRINGAEVSETNGILFEYFITGKSVFGVGDKLSTYPALKSVTCEATPKELSPYSETGPIDVVTSTIGMSNRKVISTANMGTIGKILFDLSKEIAEEFLS